MIFRLHSFYFAATLCVFGQESPGSVANAVPPFSSTSVSSAKAELEEMRTTDQSHRRDVVELEKKHGRNSPEVREAWSKQGAIDSRNIRRLEEIISEHGWPGITKFGSTAASAAFLILQHSDISYQKKYLPLARDAASKGEMRASALALLEDRVRVREGRKQIYGTQVTRNDQNEWEPLPLEDEDKVDALRSQVGIPPIAVYLQGFADRSGGRVNPKWKVASPKAPNKAPEPTPGAFTPRATEGASK